MCLGKLIGWDVMGWAQSPKVGIIDQLPTCMSVYLSTYPCLFRPHRAPSCLVCVMSYQST